MEPDKLATEPILVTRLTRAVKAISRTMATFIPGKNISILVIQTHQSLNVFIEANDFLLEAVAIKQSKTRGQKGPESLTRMSANAIIYVEYHASLRHDILHILAHWGHQGCQILLF